MNKQKYIEELRILQNGGDIEANHLKADDVLCQILKELGLEDVVEEYELIEKWYA